MEDIDNDISLPFHHQSLWSCKLVHLNSESIVARVGQMIDCLYIAFCGEWIYEDILWTYFNIPGVMVHFPIKRYMLCHCYYYYGMCPVTIISSWFQELISLLYRVQADLYCVCPSGHIGYCWVNLSSNENFFSRVDQSIISGRCK